MAEKWIKWDGGSQPVPDRTWVEIDYRKNYGTHHLLLADLVSWEHDPADACADVVRYRARPDIAEIQRLRKEGE